MKLVPEHKIGRVLVEFIQAREKEIQETGDHGEAWRTSARIEQVRAAKTIASLLGVRTRVDEGLRLYALARIVGKKRGKK